jgi:RNA polymerase sigma-70 factor (ECF subfamily)
VPDASGLVGWLVRLTRNACIDFGRRRQARPPAWDVPIEELVTHATSDPSPEDVHLETARRESLHRALRELTELNREMIVLREIQGLPIEEIARLLDVPIGTVKSRANRARLELAEKLTARERGE